MNKYKIILTVLCLSLILTGCSSFRLSTTIDDLISPIKLSGENSSVQKAVDEYCKDGYSIKIPTDGDYRTSFIFYDLDKDKNDEALAFYEPSGELGTVSMAVLKNNDGKWNVADSIFGKAADVNCVDFCDVDNDGVEEIIVCWSIISKSSSFDLNVYRQTSDSRGAYKLKKMSGSVTATDFICSDLNSDGCNEIVALTDGTYSDSPKAELYSYANGKKSKIGETKLDSRISVFKNIITGKTEEGISVYADAVMSGGKSMVTEFLYWSDYYDSIVSPFYSYSSGRTSETARNNLITSMDVDNDGTVEIPVDASHKGLPDGIKAQNWKVYKNTVLVHKCYSVSSQRDGYVVRIPDKMHSKIKTEYSSKEREMTVKSKKNNKELFRVKTVISTAYKPSDKKYTGYTKLFSNSGFVYLSKVNDKADIKISTDDLKKMIKAY